MKQKIPEKETERLGKKKQTLSDKVVFLRCHSLKGFITNEGCWIKEDDVKQSIKELIKEIRELPNRDDLIMSNLKKTDGGGVGKYEVIKLIEDKFGDKLIEEKEK